MKKWIKRIIWLIVIVALIVGGYSWSQKNKQPAEEYVTEKIERGILIQTVEATGSVESAKELELNFETTGRVQRMNIQEGDIVREDEILASLEAGDLQSKIADAQAQLQAARADLDKVLAGASDEDIEVYQKTLEQKEQAIRAAENTLESLKQKQKIEVENLRDTLLVTLDSELIVGQLSLEQGESVLNDEDAEETLGILDAISVVRTNDNLIKAKEILEISEKEIAGITKTSLDSAILSAANDLQNALDKIAVFLADVYSVMESTITSNSLSESDLNTLKSTVQTEHAKVYVSKSNIQTAKNNWMNKQIYYDDLITQAEDDIESAQEALKVAQAELKFKQAKPRSFEIDAAQAKVKQAQAALQLAQANLLDSLIKAPVEGVITKIENKVGEQTSLTSPVIRMIGLSNYEIEVDVPESDIAKIQVDQKCEITLDAFGDDKIFQGKIVFIEPAETVVQDVVYYKVRAQFDEYDQNIKPGMTANVSIETNYKENVLLVPLRAVKAANGRRFVEILDDMGIKQEKDVKLGLRGDNGYEILSGLAMGDEVVVYVKKNK